MPLRLRQGDKTTSEDHRQVSRLDYRKGWFQTFEETAYGGRDGEAQERRDPAIASG